MVQLGSEVKKGQKIGEIVNLYSGITHETPLAQSGGYVIILRNYPVVYQKEVLAIVLRKQKFIFWPF